MSGVVGISEDVDESGIPEEEEETRVKYNR